MFRCSASLGSSAIVQGLEEIRSLEMGSPRFPKPGCQVPKVANSKVAKPLQGSQVWVPKQGTFQVTKPGGQSCTCMTAPLEGLSTRTVLQRRVNHGSLRSKPVHDTCGSDLLFAYCTSLHATDCRCGCLDLPTVTC